MFFTHYLFTLKYFFISASRVIYTNGFKEKNLNKSKFIKITHSGNYDTYVCTRNAIIEKITNTKLKTLKSISTTRWTCRLEAISAVK